MWTRPSPEWTRQVNKLTLMLALVLLPCIATASPITTYAVHPIVAAPQGDEIGGALVEAFVPAGMVVSSTVGNLEFNLNTEFVMQGMVIQPTVGNLEFGIVTHAINPIGTPPQGDEIGGAWIEAFVMQGMIIQPTVGELDFTNETEFMMQGMTVQPTVGNLDFGIVTHAVNPIGITPQGDEIGGAWIESFGMQGMVVSSSISNIEFTYETEFIMQGITVQPVLGNYGTANWIEGTEWAEGTEWYNDEIIIIMSEDDASILMINGF